MAIELALLLFPPPPIPGPAQPTTFPEYEANCRVLDVDGFTATATLRVSGQGEARRMELSLDATSNGWPKELAVAPSWPRSGAWIQDVAYSYNEYGNIRDPSFLQLEIEGQGPDLKTLRIEVKRKPESAIFEQPGLVGACRVKTNP